MSRRDGSVVGIEASLRMRGVERPFLMHARIVNDGLVRRVLWEFEDVADRRRAAR